MTDLTTSYAAEIRDYLLGRLEKAHASHSITSEQTELAPRCLSWWLFEGKRYIGLELPLALEWEFVRRQVARLRVAHSPRRRSLPTPDGEIDWLATALLSVTTGGQEYVARTTGIGLSDEERTALEGWIVWIEKQWRVYVTELGAPPGVTTEPPTARTTEQDLAAPSREVLRRWAHVARRSRWPLLRNVVAETLRVLLEPQEIDRIPLPTKHDRLFELVCLVRALKTLTPPDRQLRWLDGYDGDNTVSVGDVRGRFQWRFGEEQVRASKFYPRELVEALDRHGIPLGGWMDVFFDLRSTTHPFDAVLVECKSGAQEPASALAQMHFYREILRPKFAGSMLVLGVVEAGPVASSLLGDLLKQRTNPPKDMFAFCSAAELPQVLTALGLGSASPV